MDAMIYAVVCAANNKHYVGCTTKLAKRFREHRCLLRAGRHVCQALQDDWHVHGEDAFSIILLEAFAAPDGAKTKREKEMKWMNVLKDEGRLYNENLFSYQPPPGAPAKACEARVRNGYVPSAETRYKRRIAQLGIPKGHGAKISATKRAKRAMR